MQPQVVPEALKYSPLFTTNPQVKELIDSIVRVDQAGEFGAARIYDGQLFVLKGTKEEPIIKVREFSIIFERIEKGGIMRVIV